jgi:formamidopyrimidine-DNA glycosylase
MPELPEVETIRSSLAKKIIGRVIVKIRVLSPKQFLGSTGSIQGFRIAGLDRHGKVMTWKLTLGDQTIYLVIHLKMSGRFSFHKDPHTRIQIELDDGTTLYFVDPRRLGWMRVTDRPDVIDTPDAISEKFTQKHLQRVLSKTKRDIKTALLNQKAVAGIGNIYANEALFEAGIHPLRPANNLTKDEVVRLFQAIKTVLHEGIHQKGTSKSFVYRLPDGSKGNYQNHTRVYGREGETCNRCSEKIRRISHAGRSSWVCERCQK